MNDVMKNECGNSADSGLLPLGIIHLTDPDGNVFEAWDGEIYEEAVMDAIAARILGNRRKVRG
jgi:hypothetical protein